MKYLCDPQIIPAVVPRRARDIDAGIEKYAAFAPCIHIDFSDGKFTTDSNWPLPDFVAFPKSTAHYEVHVMVASPLALGSELIQKGASRLIVHREAFPDADSFRAAVSAWKATAGIEVGCALLIDTQLSELDAVIDACDFVQLMSIDHVGHQGEHFDDRVLSRVEEFHAQYPDMMVSVDGGISEATVEQLVRAGANRLVVGHVLVESTESEALYARIHERAMLGCKPQTLELSV